MAQYDSFVALALRLINKWGRTVVVRRYTDTIPDANKPWRVVGSTSISQTAKMLDIPVPVDRPEGVLRSREDRIFVFATAALPSGLLEGDVIEDGGNNWSIQNLLPVKPGEQGIIYKALVRKWPPRSSS